jgi:hypothetical protein
MALRQARKGNVMKSMMGDRREQLYIEEENKKGMNEDNGIVFVERPVGSMDNNWQSIETNNDRLHFTPNSIHCYHFTTDLLDHATLQ